MMRRKKRRQENQVKFQLGKQKQKKHAMHAKVPPRLEAKGTVGIYKKGPLYNKGWESN